MSSARMCRIFHCDYRGDRYCCRDCWNLNDCPNPCQNDPSRCKCEDEGTRIKQGEVSRINRGWKDGG